MEFVRVDPILPEGIPLYLTVLFLRFSYFGNNSAMVCYQDDIALSHRPDISTESVLQFSYAHCLYIFHGFIMATCGYIVNPESGCSPGSILPGQHEGQQGVKLGGLEQVLKHDLLPC